MKKIVLTIVIAALCLTAGACSNDREKTEGSEPESITGESAENEGSVSSYEVGDAMPLDEELLSGTWVNEKGFFCRFDFEDREFIDPWGTRYDIISVEDDHLEIGERDLSNNIYSRNTLLPVGGTMRLDVICDGDVISLLDGTAVRSDSDEGEEIRQVIFDRLAGQTFSAASYVDIGFNEDITQVLGNQIWRSDEANIEFDGVVVNVYEGFSLYPRFIGDDTLIVADNSGILCSSRRVDLWDRWLEYNPQTGEIRMLDYSTGSAPYYSEDIVNGNKEEIDEDAPRLRRNEMGYELYYDGDIYILRDMPNGAFVGYIPVESGNDDSPNLYQVIMLINMESPYAHELLRRSSVINSEQGELYTYEMRFAEGSISVDIYENQWPQDILSFNHVDDENIQYFGDDAQLDNISGYYHAAGQIEDNEIMIDFDYEGDTQEDTSIYRIGDDLETIERIDTTFEDGHASGYMTEGGTYFLGNVVMAQQLTASNYFDVDPALTSWALFCDTGDIIDLVDMDYIRDSYNGVFVVDSVSDLASLTYFINTYPRVYEDYFMVWVDVVSDIDLTGYEWVPMGRGSHDGYIYSFSGIFCGNGHTIRGLHITDDSGRNAFFGDIYFATVIGVYLEDAYITGPGASMMSYDSSTTDYFDCHVTGELPDRFSEGDELFPVYSEVGNNGYRSCTYIITNGNGDEVNHSFTENYPHPGSTNELEDLFDPDHDGTFSYTTDYWFGDTFRVIEEEQDLETDSDGDGIPDFIEVNGIFLDNGDVVYTDPHNPDTDGDGLTDGEECGFV